MAERGSFLLIFFRGRRLGTTYSAAVVQSRINARAMTVLRLPDHRWDSFRSQREFWSVFLNRWQIGQPRAASMPFSIPEMNAKAMVCRNRPDLAAASAAWRRGFGIY